MPYFKIIRIIRETYEVKVETAEQALENATDPSVVVVLKTSVKRKKEKQ